MTACSSRLAYRVRMHYSVRSGAIALFLMVGAGCAKSPVATVAVESVAIVSQTDEGAVLVFRLHAGARGDEAISLKEVQYTVSLDGNVVFSGTRSAEATVTELRSQTISLPAPVPADAVAWPLAGVRDYQITGSLAFLRPGPIGEMMYDMGLKRRRVQFSESGGLDFGGQNDEQNVGSQAADSDPVVSEDSSAPDR